MSRGYLYIREHKAYDDYNACKLGITENLCQRDSVYATGEIHRGLFTVVLTVMIDDLRSIETMLQNEFHNLNIREDGGTEFYNKNILTLIEPFLQERNISYVKLQKEEIDELLKENKKYDTTLRNKKIKKEPRDYQVEIIEKANVYFQHMNKGMLVLTCGVGKTLISLWIMTRLNVQSLLIGVYNELLLSYWKETIESEFSEVPILVVKNGVDVDRIQRFLDSNKKCIVITTYKSSFKVYEATKSSNFVFDGQINDEAHHLTFDNLIKNDENKKTFDYMLRLKSVKQLSLTATPTISNDDEDYFGRVIDRKCLLWAINNNIVCDYVVQTILTNADQFEKEIEKFGIFNETEQRLFLSAFLSLKSISNGDSHHILIYANNTNNSEALKKYIGLLSKHYFKIPELFYSNYHSEMTTTQQKSILDNFGKSKFGIISCVYCLGEGWDFPLLDCVVFSENMTSVIRIVQSSLRAIRKDKNDVNKKAKIILPVLDKEDWIDDGNNSDLKKIKEVISQIGLEDETITQKINVFRVNVESQQYEEKKSEKRRIDIGNYDEEMTRQIRLKTMKRVDLFFFSYEKSRKILIEQGIKSKEKYLELCTKISRLPLDPEVVYKGQFIDWISYLDIKREYYDLETCRRKISEYLLIYGNLKSHYMNLNCICEELCKLDSMFPPSELWVEYYKVKNLQEIITIKSSNKKNGVVF